ncbi:MAG: NAD-glutamate dehydrogenase, partial [Hyphomonadaceae bacterium]
MLNQIREEAGNENTSGLPPEALEALGRELWDWTRGVDRAEQTLRIRASKSAPGRTLLEAAGPNRPFLVDSLLAECAAEGHEVLTLFHPILVEDDGKLFSTIQIHLPELTSDEQKTLLLEAEKTLADVATAVADYHPLKRRMLEAAAGLKTLDHPDTALRDEAAAFLDWLADDHFVFLGARDYSFPQGKDGAFLAEEPVMVEGSNLGLLRDEVLDVLHRDNEPTILTPAIGAFLQEAQPLIIARSNLFSRVHRRVDCDYVGVKKYDEDGEVCGETRFIGLFTADAYDEMARSIPLLRHRVDKVIEASGATPGGHSEKALANILETWPRDELYQTDAATLTPMALGALHLIGR